MKHRPFESIYRPDFEVVEERRGNLRLYPHTEQLPLLLRALNLEFRGALPNRIARVEARSDGFHKIMLDTAALTFCSLINGSRSDQLRLFRLLTPDLVAKVSLVQQITETTPRGLCHYFRFHAGADFFPEIYLSGKRVVFAEHVLERFSLRVPNNVGEDLTMLLLAFFGGPILALPVGASRAFIVSHLDSILAFTYKESDTEYFITTCLTVNEMNSLRVEMPPQAFNQHYGAAFTAPTIRNWLPTEFLVGFYKCWRQKVPLTLPKRIDPKKNWFHFASHIKDMVIAAGHGPASRICFVDNIPGPCTLAIRPGEQEGRYNELEAYKQAHPEHDWETIIAQRDAEARRRTPRPDR